MKRTQPVVTASPKPIFETTVALIKETIDSYLGDKLLKGGYYTGTHQGQERAVRWTFGVEQAKAAVGSPQYVLSIKVRYDPFGQTERVNSRDWYSLDCVTKDEITNALFSALTFKGSPYWFDGKVWQKRMEVM